jgi:RimJ/RimL family protein N-acetyltransferase
MILQIPTLDDCEEVRMWRNECLETLRTPYPLTAEMQEAFYRDVICNRSSPHRYWSIVFSEKEIPHIPLTNINSTTVVGFGGLTNIQWENRQAEISLIVNPDMRNKEYGEKAAHLILDQAFNYMNLELVYGECYWCNPKALGFWKKIVEFYNGQEMPIRKGKYWSGQHFGTMYFDITKDEFNGRNKTTK